MIFSLLGALALVGIGVLALVPDARLLPTNLGPERATLLFVALALLVAWAPPLWKRLMASPQACAFGVLAASVALFQLADRASLASFDVTTALAPDDPLRVSGAAVVAILGALVSFPATLGAWKRGEWALEAAIGAALLVILALGLGTFEFLSRYFSVGLEGLDPRPRPNLILGSLTLFSLALCARAATAHGKVRALVLRATPILLLIVWARHSFAPVPPPLDE